MTEAIRRGGASLLGLLGIARGTVHYGSAWNCGLSQITVNIISIPVEQEVRQFMMAGGFSLGCTMYLCRDNGVELLLSVCRLAGGWLSGVEECNFQEAPFISTEHNTWNFSWDRYYNISLLVKVIDGPLP